jgi:hypothetical protein
MRRVFLILLCAVEVLLLANCATLDEDPRESIFNGTDLAGWDGDPRLWSVQDGAIVGRTTTQTAIEKNTFLIWRGGTVDNFVLHVSYRIESGNSGIQYRSQEVPGSPWRLSGYQGDLVAGETISGIVYEERARGLLANLGQKVRIKSDGVLETIHQFSSAEELVSDLAQQDWNHYEITARGNHITHKINGVLMSEVIDEQVEKRASSGLLGLQLHTGPPMQVAFKDILLKRLTHEDLKCTKP